MAYNSNDIPKPEQEPDEVDIRSRLYQRIHELETQLAEQESVAWVDDYNACKCPDNEARCFSDKVFRMMQKHTNPPYVATPRQRTWVHATEWRGLTDEEIMNMAAFYAPSFYDFYVAIEAKLKEKNFAEEKNQ